MGTLGVSARPYQLEFVEAIWQEIFTSDTALGVLPTGGGKTVCIGTLMDRCLRAKHNMRIGMVMGRVDLVAQTELALAKVIPRNVLGVYCGTLSRKELSKPVTIASIQSISNIDLTHIDVLFIDEAHNLDQDGGKYLRFIEKCRRVNARLKIIAVTATPFRVNGVIYGEDKMFKRIAYRKTIQDMIELGFLCRPILRQGESAFDTTALRTRAGEYMQEDIDKLVSNESTMRLQINDALAKMSGRKAIAWACANIEHCNTLTMELNNLGEWAGNVHSKQAREHRDKNLQAFKDGSLRHMVFVSILSEGFDHPPIDCVVLMRPTRSPVLYVQTVGRGLRIYPEKNDCLILDYGQVVREMGPLDDPKVKNKKGGGEAVLKICGMCKAYVPGGCLLCPECQNPFPPREEPVEKLTHRSDDKAVILSEKQAPTTELLGPANISMHESKNGNKCVKIVYANKNILTKWGHGGVAEFFVVTSPWAIERLERRLETIGASVPTIPFQGVITINGTFEVKKTQEGKYDRILSLKKLSEENPAVENIEADASFDFGMNDPDYLTHMQRDAGW